MSNTANASDDRVEAKVLFKNLQANLPELEHLFAKCSGPWNYEDLIYRFYHKSLKVYSLQDQTLEIVSKLQALAPKLTLNEWFMHIVREGTGKTFTEEDNKNWLIAYKYQGKIIRTPPRQLIHNLDDIPLLAYKLNTLTFEGMEYRKKGLVKNLVRWH